MTNADRIKLIRNKVILQSDIIKNFNEHHKDSIYLDVLFLK